MHRLFGQVVDRLNKINISLGKQDIGHHYYVFWLSLCSYMSVYGLYFSLFLVFAWRDSLFLVASSVGGVLHVFIILFWAGLLLWLIVF